MIASYPSLKSSPFEPAPGYFAPIREIRANFPWQSKILSVIAAVGFVVVGTLNILITAPLKVFFISSPNSFLLDAVKSIINKKEALEFKHKRLNYKVLEELVKPEKRKIENLIYQDNILFGTSNPSALRSSMRKIYSGISGLVSLPKEFWEDFLGDIFSDNSTKIQNDLNEIDEILGDSEKIQNLMNEYENSIKSLIPKYGRLKLLKQQLESRLDALKQQLGSSNDTNLQNQIKALEEDIASKVSEMEQLISNDDIKALESWESYKNAHFETVVKQKLMRRKAFLESIKLKKNLYVTAVNNSTDWSGIAKTAALTAASVGAAGLGLYSYCYGVSIKDLAVIALTNAAILANWRNLE